jgi:hypothetical protein
METVTINDTDYNGYFYETETDSVLPMCDLRQEWNYYHPTDRKTYYTTKMKIAKISVDEALRAIYDKMEEKGCEHMAWYLFEDTPKEFKQLMQQLLDEIPNFGTVDYYVPDKHIDPNVDLEED